MATILIGIVMLLNRLSVSTKRPSKNLEWMMTILVQLIMSN